MGGGRGGEEEGKDKGILEGWGKRREERKKREDSMKEGIDGRTHEEEIYREKRKSWDRGERMMKIVIESNRQGR